jgi:predicted nucleic-acid-binding Zn-ribbon protein
MDTVPSEVPKGYYPLRYQTKAYDECTNSLRTFNLDHRDFLEIYCRLCQVKEFFHPDDLFSVLNNAEAAKEAQQKLQDFELDSESVRCPHASTLHALIPYVKRLVRLFPHIKENINAKVSSPQIRNRVYQHETRGNIENIDKNAFDFIPGALGLKEFLTSDQQVWQLQMVDGDAWTGITKVYRVLQNTSCTPNYTSNGQYTVLKLKRLLTVNCNIKELLASMETPHLLIVLSE